MPRIHNEEKDQVFAGTLPPRVVRPEASVVAPKRAVTLDYRGLTERDTA